MSYENFMAQKEIIHVTKRYKITEQQDEKLIEIEKELGISPSAIVRLALNIFLPKLRDENFKYGGIKELWGRNKF
jgi:phage terminase small subunit